MDAHHGERAEPGRLGARQGQCGIHAAAISRMGLGREYRDVQRALSHTQAHSAAADRTEALHRPTGRARDQGRCELGPPRRRTAAVQRLWCRRRCQRRAGVRQLRHARRLQGARSARDQRQGQDRDRALSGRLARTEAQARLRTWRDRLPDLFRSTRRWLFPRRYLPAGRLASGRRRAARLGGRHTDLFRRSADPGCGGD